MKKVLCCKPAPELEICVDGGDSVLLRFDISSVMALQEVEGGIMRLMEKPVPELAAIIIYAAAKSNNDNFTLDKAKQMVAFMSVSDVSEIINTFSESMGIDENEANKDLAKKLMAQFLQKM